MDEHSRKTALTKSTRATVRSIKLTPKQCKLLLFLSQGLPKSEALQRAGYSKNSYKMVQDLLGRPTVKEVFDLHGLTSHVVASRLKKIILSEPKKITAADQVQAARLALQARGEIEKERGSRQTETRVIYYHGVLGIQKVPVAVSGKQDRNKKLETETEGDNILDGKPVREV